jgi:hypothetical protein
MFWGQIFLNWNVKFCGGKLCGTGCIDLRGGKLCVTGLYRFGWQIILN